MTMHSSNETHRTNNLPSYWSHYSLHLSLVTYCSAINTEILGIHESHLFYCNKQMQISNLILRSIDQASGQEMIHHFAVFVSFGTNNIVGETHDVNAVR
jgi:hypothetical protein